MPKFYIVGRVSKSHTLKHYALEQVVKWITHNYQTDQYCSYPANISKLRHVAISLTCPTLKYDFLIKLYHGSYKYRYIVMYDLLTLWTEFLAPVLISKVDQKYTWATMYYVFHNVILCPKNVQKSLRDFMNDLTKNYIYDKQLSEQEIRNLLYLSNFLFESGWYLENELLLQNLKTKCTYMNVNIDMNQCHMLNFNIDFALIKNCLAEGNISIFHLELALDLKNELIDALDEHHRKNNIKFSFINQMTPIECTSLEVALLTEFAHYELITGFYSKARTYSNEIIKKLVVSFELEQKKNVFAQQEQIQPKILIKALCVTSSVYFQLAMYKKSRILIELAILISKNLFGVRHLEYIRVLEQYGFHLRKMEDYKKSYKCFKYVFSQTNRFFGKQSNIPGVISLMNVWVAKLKLHRVLQWNYYETKFDLHEWAKSDLEIAYLQYLKFISAKESQLLDQVASGKDVFDLSQQDTYYMTTKMRINIAKVKIELVTNFAQNKKYIKLMDCKWLVDSSLRLAQKIFKSDHLWIARINATCANVNCKILQYRKNPIPDEQDWPLIKTTKLQIEKAKSFMTNHLPKNSVYTAETLNDMTAAQIYIAFLCYKDREELNELVICEQQLIQATDICKKILTSYSYLLYQVYLKLQNLYEKIPHTIEEHDKLQSLIDVWHIEREVYDNDNRPQGGRRDCACIECDSVTCKYCLECYCNKDNPIAKKIDKTLDYRTIIMQLI